MSKHRRTVGPSAHLSAADRMVATVGTVKRTVAHLLFGSSGSGMAGPAPGT